MGTSGSKELTENPWRVLKQAKCEKDIEKDITKLEPKIPPRILLIGPVGAGKSSFINACKSVGVGWKTYDAPTGRCSYGSLTVKFRKYYDSRLLQNFCFMDCMGIEGADGKGVLKDDINLLLQGHIANNYEFNPKEKIHTKSKCYRPNPKFEDKTHCVVFVFDANMINTGISEAHVEKINWLQSKIQEAEIPRVLVLTKCDRLCSKVEKNASEIFRSVKVERAVKVASEVFNIDIASIHPVINNEVDVELSTAKNIPILLALRQILQYACGRVEKKDDGSDEEK